MTYVLAILHFLLAPLSDSKGGKLSITRILCAVFAGLLCYAVVKTLPISNQQLTAMIIVLGAAFGKSTFTFVLDKVKAGAVPS